MHDFTYISLFSGIGGFEIGILTIFPNAICLGYSEINPDALKVYEEHFPEHINLGNIINLDARRFRGKVDCLVGGSPCQDFSILNYKRKGLKGNKGKMIFEFIRILNECQPKYFIMENAVMKQEYMDKISEMISYQPVMINSEIVSAQSRKRLYWTNFPINELETTNIKLSDILEPVRNKKKYKIDLSKNTIHNKRIKTFMKMGNISNLWLTISSADKNKYHTITANSIPYLVQGKNVYKLTPLEIERLQTFPDGWTNILTLYNKRKFVLGNAVNCNVIVLILKDLS